MELRAAMPYWKHLRVPFSLTLAPIFLWGFFLAEGRLDVPSVLTFTAFHLFLYPGITAFNSAYDRDEGPVGGMLRPPPVPERLLAFSVAVQVVGALLVQPRVLPVYVAIALLGAAYSLPGIRWKSSPVASSVAVALGQGGLGCFAGWLAAGGGAGIVLALGFAAASLTTLGLYPVGQVFQVREDRSRGDRTLAVALGPARALRLGMAVLLLAGVSAVSLMALRYRSIDVAVLAAAYAASIWQLGRFAKTFERGEATVGGAFATSMRLTYLTSGAFLLFIAGHWVAI